MNYRTSYLSSFISLYAVLLFFALFFCIFLNIRYFVRYYKEQIKVAVFMKIPFDEIKTQQLEKKILSKEEVKEVIFISPKEAKERFLIQYPELSLDQVQERLFPPSFEVFFRGQMVGQNQIQKMVQWMLQEEDVDEVRYNPELVDKIAYNLNKIQFIFLGIIFLLLFISMVLIHHTIKIHLFAKRLLIRTMLLVGAKKTFIFKPYLKDFLKVGIYSGLFANFTLAIFIFVIKKNYLIIEHVFTPALVFEVFLMVLFMGAFLSVIAAQMALKKYVRLSADEIY